MCAPHAAEQVILRLITTDSKGSYGNVLYNFPIMARLVFVRRLLKNWLRRDHRNSRKYTIVTITAAKIVENIIDQVSIRCSINQWLKLADEIFAKIQ